ncbi:MAG: response regulator transcription factor [Pseudomonadota bacterium]
MTVRTIIADDHPFIREGVVRLLQDLDDYVVVAQAADGLELITQIREEKPNLVICDIAMPHLSGMEAIVEITRWCPDCIIVVLTGLTARGMLAQLDQLEVEGIFLKSDKLDELRDALPSIMAGKTVRSQSIEAMLSENSTTALSGREQQVLMGIARGETNAVIGNKLGISANTVDKHRSNLMRKLKVHSAAELLSVAIRDGLMDQAKTL